MYDPKKEEIFEIRGNVKDPAGTGLRGVAAGVNMTKTAIAHPRFRWHDRISEGDLYAIPGGDGLMLHFYCPRCREACRVTTDKKDIRWDAQRELISIEKFSCTWCALTIEVHNGVAKDCGPLGVMQGG